MREQVGQLSCLKRPGDEPGHNVVILHGFGADASDLFPLADELDPEGNWTFYFPDAPLEVPIGPQWMGRGWFPISLRDLEVGVDFTQIRPPGLDQSTNMVSDLIFHLNSKKLVLGGFSQGAMVATEVALTQPEDVAGLILLSGTLLDEPGWMKKASVLKGKKVLQSHGQNDQVIPFASSQRLYDLLKNGGAEIEWIPFGGAHEIPRSVLKRAEAFLKTI
jgi:phospholipase/carboxylesterase